MGDQPQFWSGVVLNGITWALGLISLLVLDRFVGRRWRADRSDRQFSETLNLARLVDNPAESDLARALARKRLDELGFTPEWLEAERAKEREQAEGIFKASQPDRLPADELPPSFRDTVMEMDRRLSGAGNREAVEIRIFLVLWTMIVVLMVITTFNIMTAFGWR